MRKSKTIILIVLVTFTALAMIQIQSIPGWNNETPVFDVLESFGEKKPNHFVELTPEKIARGEDLVKLGRSKKPNGKKSPYISKYYTCTSCHNLQREDPDLAVIDQDARLNYAIKNKIPYLQGSTFWGIVNRETWYNDDYVLKYGDLVRKAEHSLSESVQLCAVVCSQGRMLEDWELESILAYMWSLQIKMGDLNLNDQEVKNMKSSDSEQNLALIKSKYLLKSPATFVNPPEDPLIGYELTGRPELGKAIFELGCQHCHRPEGESEVVFRNNDLTLNWLENHLMDKGDKSIYQIIRKGTYAEYGHKEYMPHYTLEKMSHQQVEDLRAFVVQGPL